MSAPKLPVSLTRRAQRDFEELLLYSEQRWGEEQRDTHGLAIDRVPRPLGENPQLGRVRDDLGPGYRSYPAEQHVIIYRVTRRGLSVSRILHHRMDARRALHRRGQGER
jgi:toxin ParE1/3/4